jgi:hypothetical protein
MENSKLVDVLTIGLFCAAFSSDNGNYIRTGVRIVHMAKMINLPWWLWLDDSSPLG